MKTTPREGDRSDCHLSKREAEALLTMLGRILPNGPRSGPDVGDGGRAAVNAWGIVLSLREALPEHPVSKRICDTCDGTGDETRAFRKIGVFAEIDNGCWDCGGSGRNDQKIERPEPEPVKPRSSEEIGYNREALDRLEKAFRLSKGTPSEPGT